ncbi:peptidylprolyl isomerase [Nonlabens sp. YIK11]|uniref:FKBP-type peptidyl-prolyl cis-trans isomerase n=1 Tax=Nonlabens sp. YIK11 TaxID=1453349 RepID=UPI0006DC7565|nr:FKBP-type peptidyl-prolyl cis-trans isomerase [Nonlabens sp. YIK11]KQC33000.1 peptidylprolyl isomerase [Nonlabens sp. YIK11]
MNYLKKIGCIAFIAALLISCGSDDDDVTIEIRDPQEVYDEDLAEITTFLQTHFYNQDEFENTPDGEDFQIVFDTIAGDNSDRIPLSEQVTSRTLRRDDIDYQVFVLNVRQGSGDRQPTFADSTLVSYQGTLLNGSVFDSNSNSVWFDLPGTIDGFATGIAGFNDATTTIANPDGTVSFRNGGIGAMFIPSGLGYFNATQSGIPAYSPLIFTFQLRRVRITDHDGDGILSIYEDLDGDKDLMSPQFADDTDRDRISNYRDSDDDGDGILTKDENPDPNGDGNPNDALDTDGDGIPDYLDNRTEV